MISFLKRLLSPQTKRKNAQKMTFSGSRSLNSKPTFPFSYISNTGEENIVMVNGKKTKLPKTLIPTHVSPLEEFPDILIFSVFPLDKSPVDNFIAINEEGEIAWKFNEGNYLGVKHRFIKAWVDEEGDLWVKNLAGKEYKLDYKTGEVLATRWENMDFDYDGNRLRIGDREVEFEITEAKKGDRADCFNGRETEIKMVACWRGKRLFVLYGRQDTDPTKPTIGQGERVASFDAEGNQKWDKSEEFSPQGIIYYLNVIDKYLYVENGPYGIYADIKSGKKIREEMLK